MVSLNLLIIVVLIVLTCGILVLGQYAFNRRNVPGASIICMLCVASAFYTFGYAMELQSITVAMADMWSKFQYIGLPFIPALWVILSMGWSKLAPRLQLRLSILALGFSFLTCLFRMISHLIPLQYGAMSLVGNGYFLILHFERGPWYFVHFGFFCLCALFAGITYLRAFRREVGFRRRQAFLMALASFMPILALLINSFKWFPLQLDGGPFFIIFNFILFAIGIFRYNFLHLVPLARYQVVDVIQDGVIVLDQELHVLDFNPSAQGYFPVLSQENAGESAMKLFAANPALISALREWQEHLSESTVKRATRVNEVHQFEVFCPTLNRTYLCKTSALYVKDQARGTALLVSDITQQVKAMQKLAHTAQTDVLTGLWNRRYLMEHLERELPILARQEGTAAILLLDIDHFKSINDLYGHQAGDAVLCRISELLQEHLRGEDVVARYGGEEFILFLPHVTRQVVMGIGQRLLATFAEVTLPWEGNVIRFTASIGVVLHVFGKEDGVDVDALIRNADAAMYKAKEQGRNRVVLHEEG